MKDLTLPFVEGRTSKAESCSDFARTSTPKMSRISRPVSSRLSMRTNTNQELIMQEYEEYETDMYDRRGHVYGPEEEEENPLDSEDFKRFKREVIQKLLKEFNLEHTISHYKTISAKQYRMNPVDFSMYR